MNRPTSAELKSDYKEKCLLNDFSYKTLSSNEINNGISVYNI